MTNFYPGDISKLSDAEIESLMEEIESSGALRNDEYAYAEDDWLYQAGVQWHLLQDEKSRRWNLAHPAEAEARRKSWGPIAELLEAQMNLVRPRMKEIFEKSDRIASQLWRMKIK